MERVNSQARNIGFTLCTAMAAALFAGGVVSAHAAYAGQTTEASDSGESQASSPAIAKAEKRVAKSPNDAGARLSLAQAYLAAGRFEAASTTFEDVDTLGRAGPDIALARALAYIGSGRQTEARTLLEANRDAIPASDYGLAIALAGETAQGVAILSDVVRGGNATVKSRQNLAYVYALDGRWAAARVIAGQDVPADQIDARMDEWAQQLLPQASRQRVAMMLNVPVRADAGQPAELALAGRAPTQYAEATTTASLATLQPGSELPALADAQDAAPTEVATTPAPVSHALAMAEPEAPRAATPAFIPAPTPLTARAPKVRATPLAEPTAAAAFADLRPATASAPSGPAAPRAHHAGIASTHRVQLGSFRTLDGAKRSLAIFKSRNPELRDHQLEITEAQVRGQRYFRVAARDFGHQEASSFCSSVKGRGAGCFAYAEKQPLPGAVGGVLFADRGTAPATARERAR
ncbi:tetratricopeptide repeat protein [Novosphingobium colocasiae]|uniref:SPOR domain-containing protein n=1 Tax=Novosphingobium colocasiae TaxID=1256513 RepID=A0A918UG82_9SPHN|nr:tetratricopeptide repeat protein [Novosphingobium colocasiae]GGZ04148.1 hypothetical protein GCM10011614_18930 [Novosphingobium colocasiae]